jgi:hypothetical protein
MLKFRPISYNEGDFRAFKFTSATSVLEGRLCHVSSGSQSSVECKYFNKATFATFTQTTVVGMASLEYWIRKDSIFPIYVESADIESIAATINTNDYVIGFFGNEFEVHADNLAAGSGITSWALGQKVGLSLKGMYCATSATSTYAGVVIGACIGTFNGTWLRVRR